MQFHEAAHGVIALADLSRPACELVLEERPGHEDSAFAAQVCRFYIVCRPCPDIEGPETQVDRVRVSYGIDSRGFVH